MRVLHAIHDFLPRHRAGSEIYAYELCRSLRERGHEVHVLCAEYDPSRPDLELVWRWVDGIPVTELINNWCFESFADSYASPAVDEVLEHAVRAIRPDVVHIHNLLNLSFGLPRIARRLGIPSVATLHEYVLLCPSGGQRVHLAEQHVCFEIDPARCARCFEQSPFHAQMMFARVSRLPGARSLVTRLSAAARRLVPGSFARLGARAATIAAARRPTSAADIDRRLAAARDVFDAVDVFVAPSPALATEFLRHGLSEGRLRVSDYGFVPMRPARRQHADGPLRIGFVGTLVWHKGAHVVIEALRQLPPLGWRARFYGSTETFPEYSAALRRSARGLPVVFEGGFDRDRVAEVFGTMDVLVVPSLWPENSPLVIHEAFQAGVPVVGSRLGGTADLVSDGVNGLLYEAFSAEDLAAALRRLIEEPGLSDVFAAHLPAVKSIEEDAREWEETYREVTSRAAALG